jgi:hypothetical protein
MFLSSVILPLHISNHQLQALAQVLRVPQAELLELQPEQRQLELLELLLAQ